MQASRYGLVSVTVARIACTAGDLRPIEPVGGEAGGADREHRGEGGGGDGERAAGGAAAGAPERALDEGPGRPGEQDREGAEAEERGGRERVAEADAGEGEDRLVPEIGGVADEADADQRRGGEHAAGGIARAGVADDEAGAGAGEDDRQHVRELRGGGDGRRGRRGGRRARGRGRRGWRGPGPSRGAAPSRSSQARKGSRKKAACGCAAAAQAARARLAAAGGEDGDEEAAPAPEGGEREREQEVELLLDAEAPGVQQRQVLGGGAEVVELLPVEDVGDGEDGRDEAAGEVAQLERREPGEGEGDAGEEDGDQRRQDAAGAALVEAGDGEAPRGEVAQQDAGDQVAGDHEEDVDAEPAAGEGGEAGVEEDDREDGDGAQAVDLAAPAVGGRRGSAEVGGLDQRRHCPSIRRPRAHNA